MRHSNSFARQRGFFAIGIGIGLLAVFAGTSLGIKQAVESEPATIASPSPGAPHHENAPTDVAVAHDTFGD